MTDDSDSLNSMIPSNIPEVLPPYVQALQKLLEDDKQTHKKEYSKLYDFKYKDVYSDISPTYTNIQKAVLDKYMIVGSGNMNSSLYNKIGKGTFFHINKTASTYNIL